MPPILKVHLIFAMVFSEWEEIVHNFPEKFLEFFKKVVERRKVIKEF